MVENPWPEFTKVRRRTVKTILAEIGSGIEERTEGAIAFLIDTELGPSGSSSHDCQLYVRSLKYSYPFLIVTHSLKQYPAEIYTDPNENAIISRDEDEFTKNLVQIIQSEATFNVVTQLLDAAN